MRQSLTFVGHGLFFRGNLEDPVSLDMARDFCPGIRKNVAFEDFVSEGLEYLRKNDLLASDSSSAANSLVIPANITSKKRMEP